MNWTRYLIVPFVIGLSFQATGHADEPHRSPVAVAISPNGKVCITANLPAGTVSLVDLDSMKLLNELSVGQGPSAVVWLNETTILVSLWRDGDVNVVTRDGNNLRVSKTVPVGNEPNGLAVAANRRRVFVSLGGDDAIAVLDLEKLLQSNEPGDANVVSRIPVGGIPKTLAVSPDERWLVTCCSVPCEVFVHDTETLKEVSARKIFDGGFNPGIPAVSNDSQLVILPSAINRAFSVTAQMIDIGWVIDNRLSKLPLPDGEPADQKQLGLDIRGKAVGDANSVTFSPNGETIVVTCGGTHELLVLEFPSIPWPKGDPGDFLPDVLKRDSSRFRRIKLGGRPMDAKFLDHRRVIVANSLGDSLQVVDIESNRITGTVSLGGPAEPDQIRRGEIVFYDADRSLHSWFSCHTCHTEGHTSGQVFDTRNDKSYGTPKLVPSLRDVAETGPWTWHGWQTDLNDAMRRSLTESMNTEQPISRDDVESLVAYMKTLAYSKKSPSKSTETTVVRGQALFEGKAGCAKCHSGSHFTSLETFDGAVKDPKDRNELYNPPTLRGVSTRRRFLHTGKAKSLEQVLTKFHRPDDLVGESLDDDEIKALVEFLKSL